MRWSNKKKKRARRACRCIAIGTRVGIGLNLPLLHPCLYQGLLIRVPRILLFSDDYIFICSGDIYFLVGEGPTLRVLHVLACILLSFTSYAANTVRAFRMRGSTVRRAVFRLTRRSARSALTVGFLCFPALAASRRFLRVRALWYCLIKIWRPFFKNTDYVRAGDLNTKVSCSARNQASASGPSSKPV